VPVTAAPVLVTGASGLIASRIVGSYLRTHVGRMPRYDTSEIQRELGVQFRPLDQTILETMADLERWRHIRV
jgi:hypothetical protein